MSIFKRTQRKYVKKAYRVRNWREDEAGLRNRLFLNLIDPPIPLFQLESFAAFMSFAQQQYDDGASVLIHCNQGDSRAPSLALLFLAKHLQVIPSDSYETAAEAFVALYRDYRPGGGIRSFLKDHWPAL